MHRTGGAEVLVPEELPDPVPGPGQVLVRIEATGVNFIEVYQRTGAYPIVLPTIPGNEAAGVVVARGEGVVTPEIGARVAGVAFAGAYAELALAAAGQLVPIPAGVTTQQAAAVMLQGMTAHYLACTTRPLGAGDTCLVYAAAGGVGLLLVQIARRRGARVIGVVSNADKAAAARAAGAHEIILAGTPELASEVRRMTGGRGVDVVYDSVGRATFEASLTALAPRGMLVLYGQSSGAVPPFDPQRLNKHGSLFLTRPKLGDYIATPVDLVARAGEVLGWVENGALAVRVHATLPLSQAGEAQRLLESRATIGKLLLLG